MLEIIKCVRALESIIEISYTIMIRKKMHLKTSSRTQTKMAQVKERWLWRTSVWESESIRGGEKQEFVETNKTSVGSNERLFALFAVEPTA